jgi:hypothetical protein
MLQLVHSVFMPEKAVRKTTAVKRTPRRTATKKVAARKVEPRKMVAKAAVRKAPSRAAIPVSRKKGVSKAGMVISILCLLLIGTGVAIGYTDGGHIDVSSVITSRKQQATPEERTRLETVPVQQGQPAIPNGGLVGAGKSKAVPPPVAETADSTTPPTDATEVEDESVEDSEDSEMPEETSEISIETTGTDGGEVIN